jgi:hypothetical protein
VEAKGVQRANDLLADQHSIGQRTALVWAPALHGHHVSAARPEHGD